MTYMRDMLEWEGKSVLVYEQRMELIGEKDTIRSLYVTSDQRNGKEKKSLRGTWTGP